MDNDYKVADINLAEFGRREISLAENEMPALMDKIPVYFKGKIKTSNAFEVKLANCFQ